MQRALIVLGVILLLAGVFWPWLGKLSLFRLPGDFRFESGHFRFYFPVTSMIIVSIALSILFWFLRK